MTQDNEPDKMLALNGLTGLVHDYKGTAPGGLGADKTGLGIGIISCGCEGFEGAVENDTLTVINQKHLENGIWEPAPCLDNE